MFDDADPAAVAEGIKIAGYWNSGQDCTAASRVILGHGKVYDKLLTRRARGRGDEGGRPGDERGRRDGPGDLEGAAGARARLPRAGVRREGDTHRRRLERRPRLLRQADRRRGGRPGRRDRPERGLRPRRHRPALRRRRRGDRDGRTTSATGSPPRSSRRTSAARWPRRASSSSAPSGSTSTIPLVSEMPHGGFKESGYGKDMSLYSMEEYTRIKHVDGEAGRDPGVLDAGVGVDRGRLAALTAREARGLRARRVRARASSAERCAPLAARRRPDDAG